jgi:hypothetical protein
MSDAENERRSLREQVESLLPSWQSWYPSLFDAAQDLGLIRARVCAPSLLMLSNRHAHIQSEALQAFKEQWCVEDEPAVVSAIPHGVHRHLRNTARQFQRGHAPHGHPRNNPKRR